MSWSTVLSVLNSKSVILSYNLYKPGSSPGVTLYYFNNDPQSIPALCRFVDRQTGLPVKCPVQGVSYFMEVRGPPTGLGNSNEYLLLAYQSEGKPTLPPGLSFTFTRDKNYGKLATYFVATGPITDGYINFQVFRADKLDVVNHIQLYMADYPFNCQVCGCLPNHICTESLVCSPVGIEPPPGSKPPVIEPVPEPEPPIVIPPSQPEEPIEQPPECSDQCGGQCYGQCPKETKCSLNSTLQYECIGVNDKPIWIEWWFWLTIVGALVIFILLGTGFYFWRNR